MKDLSGLKSEFKSGLIGKEDYIRQMHQIHQFLFQYSELIRSTDISDIEISDGMVVMTSRKSGIRMVCDKDDRRIIPIEIINFDTYEETEANIIYKLIGRNMNVFDIGANIGWFTMNVQKTIEGVKLFAFEPIPKTFGYLKTNLEMNNITDVSLYNFGFSNEDKELIFYYYPEVSGNASLTNLTGKPDAEQIVCRVKKLDDFVLGNDLTVDFIKCDVEGAELFVFQGGIEVLKKQRPIVFAEMLRKWCGKFNYHPNKIIELFTQIGYMCYAARGENLVQIQEITEQTVDTNFFFLHGTNHADSIEKLVL